MNLKTILFVLWLVGTSAFAADFPEPIFPAGVGVNIHFTTGQEKDLDLIAAAGFKFIRMDFIWEHIEKARGQYDWSAYDELTANLEKRGLRALYILDYSNPLYEKEVTSPHPITREIVKGIASPQNPESIAAFAKWAAAAATHFKGRRIIWEIWNEPNGHFWRPEPNVAQYTALALATAKAIREADKDATIIGPATAGMPLDFLEGFLKSDVLEYIDGLSVHPYRDGSPETAAGEYTKVRELIDNYAPAGKKGKIQLLSGEWGYPTSTQHGVPLETQAAYAARQQLINLLNGIPLSIWYDWKNDGTDPAEREHNFGTVMPDLAPKPAYTAIQTLTRELSGFHFVRRITTPADSDYILVFENRTCEKKLVFWTTAEPRSLDLGTVVVISAMPQYLPLHGIQCYGAGPQFYRPEGAPAIRIELGEPHVICIATNEQKWGFYQFPTISRWSDGTLEATWSMKADSITAYGKPGSGSAISKDGGKTWTPFAGKSRAVGGLALTNGDRIRVTTPNAVEVSKLNLPKPVGAAVDNYGKTKQILYKLSELPADQQVVHIERLPKGETNWIAEKAALIDPLALRYSLHDLFPIVWWGDMRVASDNSVIAGIYPGFRLLDNGTADPYQGTFFYRSTDFGRTWNVQGRIPYQPDLAADPKGTNRMGFTEPAFEILPNGTFVCVMRTTDGAGNGPMYIARSSDLGRNWSKPEVIAPWGVLPRLLQLDNGVLVLSAGRPGVQLRFSTDGAAREWSDPFEMLPYNDQNDSVSCGYTGLLPTGPDRFLLIYSDFKHPDGQNHLRKAIKVREITLTKLRQIPSKVGRTPR